MNDLNAKQTSQAKLINGLMAVCQQATACTAIEVLGALECVKADLSTRMVLSRPTAAPALVTPTTN